METDRPLSRLEMFHPSGTVSPSGSQDSAETLKILRKALHSWDDSGQPEWKIFLKLSLPMLLFIPWPVAGVGKGLVNVPDGQAWAPNTCRTLYSGPVSAQSIGSPLFFIFFLFGSSHHWALPFRWISNLIFLILWKEQLLWSSSQDNLPKNKQKACYCFFHLNKC